MKMKQKVLDLSPQMLLTFLDNDEQSDLFYALRVQSPEDLKNFSTSHVLLAIANLRSPFILMMRDIAEILSTFEVHIEGNIQVIVLPDQGQEMRIDFGPQLRAFIVGALDSKLLSDHSDIVTTRLRECEEELTHLFDSLQPNEVVRTNQPGKLLQKLAKKFDHIDPVISRECHFGADKFSHRNMEFNPADAQGVRELSERVADLYGFASKMNEQSLPDSHTSKVIQAIEQLKDIADDKDTIVAKGTSREYPEAPRSVREEDFHRCQQRIDALAEAILALSNQKESLDNILDFMKLEVWRQRWRIYELWLLARIVLSLIKLGGQVKPLQRVSDGAWALKFTKDEEPVTQLILAGVEINVYYQFYRAASYGGDMPDIAVEVPGHGFILVLDPKHYRQAKPSEFKAVCKRYAESFNPFLSCVSNYFPHNNQLEYVDDNTTRLLIYDVAPGTTCLATLEEAYNQAIRLAWRSWGIPTHSIIILFDISGSTSNVRAEMITNLKKRLKSISASEQSILLPFSTKPAEAVSITQLWESDFRLPVPSGGTDFNLAFESAFHFALKMLGSCDIWLYSDGVGSMDPHAIEVGLTQSQTTLKIIDFAQEEDKSVLSRLKEIPTVNYEYSGYSTYGRTG